MTYAPQILRRKYARWLAGSAMVGALAGMASSAQAQSFQANGVVADGAALISTAPNVTDIELRTPETVINWTPTDTNGTGTIDFQPVGTTANFFSLVDPNFTVLNRIIPVDATGNPVARAIAFNGAVNSFFPTNTGNVQTGNVWFYSPTGIIVGSTGVFNVGSLILTTNDITFGTGNTGGSVLFGPGGLVQFRGPANSAGFVQINAGAQINAAGSATGSYVALVAPRVVQSGTLSADGSIAYIAAEEVDLTINAGLFDINILTGTTDPNGIVHTGTTTGPASTAAGDQQIISMVALPKNAAMTMLLGGSIGYTPAAVAANDGSAVVLSAGYTSAQPTAQSPSNLGNIEIGNASFANRVDGYASGRIDVLPAGGSTDFASNVSLYAQQAISLVAGQGEAITVGGTLDLASAQSGQGGAIELLAQGGTIDVASFLFVDASSNSDPFFSTFANNGVGGTVSVLAEGAGGISGSISAPQAFLSASGIGYDDVLATGGSDGIGGTVSLTAGALGTLTIGNLFVDASGFGGGSGMDAAGDGFGGDINLLDQGGLLALGNVSLFADGGGGFGQTESGAGFGGRILVDITSQAQDWVTLFANATSFGVLSQGAGSLGGQAVGDPNAITLNVAGPGSLNIQQAFDLGADAESGTDLAPGLSSEAGGIAVNVTNGGALTINGNFFAHADARIASEGSGFPAFVSPDQFGGTVAVNVDGGTITANEMLLSANAESTSAAVSAGSAFGGDVSLVISGGGNVTLFGDRSNETLQMRANASGFSGEIASDAFGGTSRLSIDGGTLDVTGNIQVIANANQGVGSFVNEQGPGNIQVNVTVNVNQAVSGFAIGQGYTASGGSAIVEMGLNGGSLTATDLDIIALGFTGTDSVDGDAGDGFGGIAALNVNGGTINLNNLIINANGLGGTSGFSAKAAQGQSGDGIGGTAALTQTAGAINTNLIFVTAAGIGGGRAAPGGLGTSTPLAGDGFGGNALVRLGGGTLTTNLLGLTSAAVGGQGHDDVDLDPATVGGNGGNATGGDARLVFTLGSTATLTSGQTLISAAATGGLGGTSFDTVPINGNGGNAAAGTAIAIIADGSFDLGITRISADGIGGDGEIGGDGIGGVAGFAIIDTLAGTPTRDLASLELAANGIGGAGITTAGSGAAGATLIGLNMLDPAAGPNIAGNLDISALGAIAAAGNGLDMQISGGTLAVGGNTSINTTRDVTMTIAAGGLFDTAGTLDINAREVISSGFITAGGNATVIAPVGITLTDLAVGGATLLQSAGGPVSVTNDLSSVGLVTATGTSINLRALSTLNIADALATAGDITLSVDGATSDLIIAQADATGAITSSTADGSILVNGPVAAATTVSFAAGGLLAIDATVLGAVINASSSLVDVSPTAQIGAFGTTQSVTFTNSSAAGDTFVGGADVVGEYSLTQAELDRISADNAITVASSGSGLFSLSDVTVVTGAGGSLGDGGRMSFVSGGDLFVAGAVALETADPASTLQLSGQQVLVSTDTGSVVVVDAEGILSGNLQFDAQSLIVASAAALAELGGGTTDVTQASDRLGIADGAASEAGYLQADRIAVTVSDRVYVQNSGASDEFVDRRGFTANAFEINTASATTQIAINGVIQTAGGPVTGLDTIPLITINGSPAAAGGQFDPRSTVNGCIIGLACRLDFVPRDTQSEDQLTGVTHEGDPTDGGSLVGGSTVIEIRETEPLITPPLIDEPITGVGNDDLWLVECDPELGADCLIEEGAQ